jgi:hypothetical protein
MITTIILYIIYLFVFAITSPFRLLSDVILSQDTINAFTQAGQYIKPLGAFLPTTTLIAVLLAVVGIEVAIFSYKGIMWTLKRIPTQS